MVILSLLLCFGGRCLLPLRYHANHVGLLLCNLTKEVLLHFRGLHHTVEVSFRIECIVLDKRGLDFLIECLVGFQVEYLLLVHKYPLEGFLHIVQLVQLIVDLQKWWQKYLHNSLFFHFVGLVRLYVLLEVFKGNHDDREVITALPQCRRL